MALQPDGLRPDGYLRRSSTDPKCQLKHRGGSGLGCMILLPEGQPCRVPVEGLQPECLLLMGICSAAASDVKC